MQLLVMLAIALGMLLLTSIVTAVLQIGGVDIISSTGGMLSVQAFTQVLTFAVPVLLMTAIYYKGCAREYYRLDFGRRSWRCALAGVAILLLLVPAIDWLTVWNDGWDLGGAGAALRALQEQTESVLQQLMGTTTVGGLLANLLVVALVPAVCEELFFRAGIQNLMQRWLKNPHAAIWITAVLFSLGHGELFAFIPRLLMGAVLGYLYVYSGSLLPNMLAHFTNNALVVLLYWLSMRGVVDIDPDEPLRVGALLTACCTLAAAALFAVTFLFRGRHDKAQCNKTLKTSR